MDNPVTVLNKLIVIIYNLLGKPMVYVEPHPTLTETAIILLVLAVSSYVCFRLWIKE
jgi:hypothetical protein